MIIIEARIIILNTKEYRVPVLVKEYGTDFLIQVLISVLI